MKNILKYLILILGITVMLSSGIYANSTPSPDINNSSGLEQPPASPDFDDLNYNGDSDDNGDLNDSMENNISDPKNCDWNQYFDPFTNQCVQIVPPNEQSLTNGIWLSLDVDLSTFPPTPTGKYTSCIDIKNNNGLKISFYEKTKMAL